MNIEQLNGYIENKEPLDQKAIAQIMLLIEKNPYFQIAHMLLLKAMYLTQPEKYNGQLKISASFISNKKKLYQYIHGETDIKLAVVEKKEVEKIEKVPELINDKKVSEIIPKIEEKTIISVEKEKTDIKNTVAEKIIDSKVEEKTIQTEKTKVVEEIIKKPEIKKKVDLPETEIERLANQNSELKHKKIVTDFFHTPAKEILENTFESEQESINVIKSPDIKEKKEFPGKQEIKSILEEKKKNIIAKNEPIIPEKKSISTIENKKVEEETSIDKEIIKRKPIIVEKVLDSNQEKKYVETIQNKEIDKVEEKLNPVSKLIEPEVINSKENVIETENKTTEKLGVNKTKEDASDTMNNIFSKIRQIKKEMNIETGKSSETIDIGTSNQKSKTEIIDKTEDKKGRGRVIKESFIGFEESEIKTDELIGEGPIKIEKEQQILPEKEKADEIKTSGLTAKDLFKQHLRNREKETEEKTSISSDDEETKSPISKIVEKINQAEIEVVEKNIEPKTVKAVENQEQVKHENLTPTYQGKSSAADELLKRIAEKKRLMQEEREQEELEKLKAKENLLKTPEIKIEEKIETSANINEQKEEVQEAKTEEMAVNLNVEKSELPKEKKSQHLIDSFIEKVDTLERIGKKETSIVGDISEKSTEENDDFMTETMADLYVQQKNYQKAIEIYNKLILKFPEKKTYFAIQIKKTESQIK
jgi:hypothetical protein